MKTASPSCYPTSVGLTSPRTDVELTSPTVQPGTAAANSFVNTPSHVQVMIVWVPLNLYAAFPVNGAAVDGFTAPSRTFVSFSPIVHVGVSLIVFMLVTVKTYWPVHIFVIIE